ncbi:MAG: N-acetylmuramoyl-L-alanine amidase family protein [Clostridiales bacterium]|jgi:N-acetylmuramoyl-L-alanine amidase|nr:N-acetylmuramoyl-L-alanine amidase family protein [Clostridiales bacterium]
MSLFKKIRLFCILSFLTVPCFALKISAAESGGKIELFVNGRNMAELNVAPVKRDGNVLVPAREVFESVGAVIEWRETEQQLRILYHDRVIAMTLGQLSATVNGEVLVMQAPPVNIDGKIMVPLRFTAERLGFEITFREEGNLIYLYVPLIEPPDAAPVPPAVTPVPAAVSPPPPASYPPPAASEIPVTVSNEPQSPNIWFTNAQPTPPPVSINPASPEPARDVSRQTIQTVQYPETTLKELLTPLETRSAAYTAVTTSPITEVQKLLLPDNRLVVDIVNAQCDIYAPFYVDASVPVTAIRASQFSVAPMTARIVFDLNGAAEYSVQLSEDRMTLTVSFEQHNIQNVTFRTNGASDTITITGSGTPVVQIYPQTNPDRIDIFLANAVLPFERDETQQGAYVSRMVTWQGEDGSACIEAHVKSFSSYDVEYGANSATVRFFPNTYQNMRYDSAAHSIIIPKSSGLRMDINAVRHTDEYTDYRYTLTLPVDAEGLLGHGEMIAGDGYVHSVLIERGSDGFTQLVVNEARVLAFTAHETGDSYIFKANLPRDLYPRIVVIDPGHGGSEPGAMLGDAVKEKDLDLSISMKLMSLFDTDPNIKAYATRLTDTTFAKENRPPYANELGDMFISVHINAAEYGTAPNGIETWYYPHENDGQVGLTCERLAEVIQKNMVGGTGAVDRGIKEGEIVVLHYTTIPAALCETGFLSNPGEAAKLMNPDYQWQLARSIYSGIVEAFREYTPGR